MDKELLTKALGALSIAGIETALPRKSPFERCEVTDVSLSLIHI